MKKKVFIVGCAVLFLLLVQMISVNAFAQDEDKFSPEGYSEECCRSSVCCYSTENWWDRIDFSLEADSRDKPTWSVETIQPIFRSPGTWYNEYCPFLNCGSGKER